MPHRRHQDLIFIPVYNFLQKIFGGNPLLRCDVCPQLLRASCLFVCLFACLLACLFGYGPLLRVESCTVAANTSCHNNSVSTMWTSHVSAHLVCSELSITSMPQRSRCGVNASFKMAKKSIHEHCVTFITLVFFQIKRVLEFCNKFVLSFCVSGHGVC